VSKDAGMGHEGEGERQRAGGRGTPEPLLQSLTHELSDLGSAIDLIGQATAGRLGIQQADLICLNLLVREGPLTPGQVAATLGLSTATIGAMATRLETGGLAFREVDPADRGQVLMHPSPSGAQLAVSMFDNFYQATAESASTLQEHDIRRLIMLVAGFRRAITGHGNGTRT
jgi:DNA-binding MarR family transcriptional regulator